MPNWQDGTEAMAGQTVAFIGLGLIGGSIARGIKRANPDIRIMAYMRTRLLLEKARAEGIVDVILDGIDHHLSQCDMIFLCTPVEYNADYLKSIRPYLKPGAILTDVGSTKTNIHEEVKRLHMEDCFVGGHPMAGSEKTGYENSTDHLLENAYYIVTPSEQSTPEQVERVAEIARTLGAIPMVLDYREHDRAVAAISHLPHLIASSLVNLVKSCDNSAETMKQIAAGGFKDITRIASSSPEMWEQICMANSGPIAEILEQYIASLSSILDAVKSRKEGVVFDLLKESREYRNSITDRAKGAIEPDYSFSVDIVDEAGAISTLSVILAAKGISIKNIGINNNREQGEGALRITFYDEESLNAAWAQLTRYHYELFRQ